VGRPGDNLTGTLLLEQLRGPADCSARRNHIIAHHNIPAFHLTDNLPAGHLRTVQTPLVDNRQIRPKFLGIPCRFLHISHIRRYHRQILQMLAFQIAGYDQFRRQMIHGDIKKALQLSRMQIECKHPIGTGRYNQIGCQFSRNRHTPFIFAVLAGIAEIRNHRGDARSTGPPKTIQKYQQLHQIFIHRLAGRLYHKAVRSPNIAFEFDNLLSIRKPPNPRLARLQIQIPANRCGQFRMTAAAEHYQRVTNHRRPSGWLFPFTRPSVVNAPTPWPSLMSAPSPK